MKDRYLSDEEFGDALAGRYSSDVWSHLSTCDRCRTELDRLGDSLRGMNTLGLKWSERRAEELRLSPAAGICRRYLARPIWGVPATFALALMMFLSLQWIHNNPDVTHRHELTPSAETVAADNALMARIDQEMNAPITPRIPFGELHLSSPKTASQPPGQEGVR